MLKVVTFKAPEPLIDEIDRAAARIGATRSELIRAGLLRVLRDPPSREELANANLVLNPLLAHAIVPRGRLDRG